MEQNTRKDCKHHCKPLPSRSWESVLGKVRICSALTFFPWLWILISCRKDLALNGLVALVSVVLMGTFCVRWGFGQIMLVSGQSPTAAWGVSAQEPDTLLQQPGFLLQLCLDRASMFKPKCLFLYCNPMITLKQVVFL